MLNARDPCNKKWGEAYCKVEQGKPSSTPDEKKREWKGFITGNANFLAKPFE